MTVVLSENMQKLVAALRSGEFKQAKGKLNRLSHPVYIQELIDANEPLDEVAGDHGMTLGNCCLGVASELAVRDGVVEKNEARDMDGARIVLYGKNGDENFMPPEVADWLGVPDQRDLYFDMTPEYDKGLKDQVPGWTRQKYTEAGGKFVVRASDLNDRYNYTFAQIADLIENGRLVDVEDLPGWV